MRVIKHPRIELWEQVVNECDYATFFHTPAWAQLITSVFPEFQIETRGFGLDDGTVAIVPLVASVERNGVFSGDQSIYPGGYGGAVARRPLRQVEIDQIFLRLLDSRAAHIHVMGNPFSEYVLPECYERSGQFTQRLDLDLGFEAILKNYSDGLRRYTKKAAEQGIRAEPTEALHDFEDYYRVYEEALERWGDKVLITFPHRLFEEIQRRRLRQVRLWVARSGSEVMAGVIVLCHKRCVIVWHAAMRARYAESRANCLVYSEAIRDACQQRYRWFDFSPSGGVEGVVGFKQRFGAVRVPFCSYRWQDNRLRQAYHRAVKFWRTP